MSQPIQTGGAVGFFAGNMLLATSSMTAAKIAILEALKDHFVAAVQTLPEGDRFTVRHYRFRETNKRERPCVAIRVAGNQPTGLENGSADQLSTAEEVWALAIDLIADVDLPPEVDPGEDGIDSDPTGLETGGSLIDFLMSTLFTTGEEAENLGGLIWDIRIDGDGDDDDSSPDAGRMVQRLTLLYRVRAENPNELLTG